MFRWQILQSFFKTTLLKNGLYSAIFGKDIERAHIAFNHNYFVGCLGFVTNGVRAFRMCCYYLIDIWLYLTLKHVGFLYLFNWYLVRWFRFNWSEWFLIMQLERSDCLVSFKLTQLHYILVEVSTTVFHPSSFENVIYYHYFWLWFPTALFVWCASFLVSFKHL